MALFEALVRDDPERRDYRIDLARAQSDLGVYFEGYSTTVSGYSPTRNLGESLRWFERAAESYRSLVGHLSRQPRISGSGFAWP